MTRAYDEWLDMFLDDFASGHAALDVGCGRGHDTLALVEAGLRVVAFDREPDSVRQAVGRAPAAAFVVADLRAGLPFGAARFDLLVASLSLHYFDQATTRRIVTDLGRVARPAATLLARVNTVGDVASLWGVGVEREPDYFEVEPGLCKRFFDEATLRAALEPVFEVGLMARRSTLVSGTHLKQTLVVRARRRAD